MEDLLGRPARHAGGGTVDGDDLVHHARRHGGCADNQLGEGEEVSEFSWIIRKRSVAKLYLVSVKYEHTAHVAGGYSKGRPIKAEWSPNANSALRFPTRQKGRDYLKDRDLRGIVVRQRTT